MLYSEACIEHLGVCSPPGKPRPCTAAMHWMTPAWELWAKVCCTHLLVWCAHIWCQPCLLFDLRICVEIHGWSCLGERCRPFGAFFALRSSDRICMLLKKLRLLPHFLIIDSIFNHELYNSWLCTSNMKKELGWVLFSELVCYKTLVLSLSWSNWSSSLIISVRTAVLCAHELWPYIWRTNIFQNFCTNHQTELSSMWCGDTKHCEFVL